MSAYRFTVTKIEANDVPNAMMSEETVTLTLVSEGTQRQSTITLPKAAAANFTAGNAYELTTAAASE